MDVNFSQSNQIPKNNVVSSPVRDSNDFQNTEKLGSDSAISTKRDAKIDEIVKVDPVKADIKNEEVESAVTEINQFVQAQNRQLNFSFDENSKRSVIKVTDSESGDIIRQIPSEDVLKLSERLKELQTDLGAAVGVLFNKEV